MPRKEEYWKNPDKCREWTRNYYHAHKTERIAYVRRYTSDRIAQDPEHHRQHGLKYSYRMSVSAYDQLMDAQRGRCAVCGHAPTKQQKRLHVDHCHRTGTIRGLLCNNCNSAIGNAKESIDRLRELIAYLERTPPDVPRLPPARLHRKKAPPS